MSRTDCVRASTVVAVDPQTAFEIFTTDIDQWWKRDRRFRAPADQRLAFEWRARNFGADQLTEVEVLFESERHAKRVSLEHRGWDSIALDHPARHGFSNEPAFRAFFGSWWADLLVALGRHAETAE